MKNLSPKLLIPILVGAVIFIGIVSWYGYDLIFKKEKPVRSPAQKFDTGLESQVESPTLSPERKEIVSKMKSHKIVISDGAFSPANLTIKVHDQVQWNNKESENCQIKTEDWQSPPIRPGKNFTQAFNEPGNFPYSCSLHPEIKGTIIVE